MYGITETTVHVTWRLLGEAEILGGGGSVIGVPLRDLRVYVLDPCGVPVPVGVAGELHVGGAGVSAGYLGRPELTAERFVPDGFGEEPGARLYRSGDLGRWRRDGELEYLGRIDHQVKVRGFRIEPGEIEAALTGHPAVREAEVLLRTDLPGGSGLVAYFVADGPGEERVRQLRRWLEERLPGYMVPVAFVPLGSLPQTPNGKIDRRALERIALQKERQAEGLAAPRTPTEELLAGIWAQVLGLERVGMDESFFELGGHSLLATQVLVRVRSTFDTEVPLRALFETPTVAGLAAEIERRRRPDGAPAGATIAAYRQDRSSPPPVSFGQERFWHGRQAEAKAVPATIMSLLALTGGLDLGCLRRAFQEVVDRHEVLRTTFRDDPSGPVQVVHSELSVQLPLVDLEGIAPSGQWMEIQRWSVQDARSPFDYEHGPLIRITVFRRSERESVVLYAVHHVAFDWWSETILANELSALYNAFRAGRPSPLPPLAAQYQDFARWQRQTFAGEALDAQVTFWREHLRGAVPVDLCGDRPRPVQRTFTAGIEEFIVPKALEKKLEPFAAAHGVTLFMTLLAAFKALLRDATGQDDLVVTCLFANRTQPEIENLIGYFSTGLPLRTSGARTFHELLERVRAVTLGAHEHPYILYEQVLDGASFLEPGDRGGIKSFRVMFQLIVAGPPSEQALTDIQVSRLPLDTGRIGQDLTLFLTQAGRLEGRFRYNRDVLDEERVTLLRDRFLQILAAGIADPDVPLAELLPREAGVPGGAW
jgi:acyl carrier protein